MTTTGLLTVVAVFCLGLYFAAIGLRALPAAWTGRLLIVGLIVLAAGGLSALVLGYTVPPMVWTYAAPLAAGALIALLTRRLGYGVLAGLVVVAAGM